MSRGLGTSRWLSPSDILPALTSQASGGGASVGSDVAGSRGAKQRRSWSNRYIDDYANQSVLSGGRLTRQIPVCPPDTCLLLRSPRRHRSAIIIPSKRERHSHTVRHPEPTSESHVRPPMRLIFACVGAVPTSTPRPRLRPRPRHVRFVPAKYSKPGCHIICKIARRHHDVCPLLTGEPVGVRFCALHIGSIGPGMRRERGGPRLATDCSVSGFVAV